jgi:hypothetical protein
VLGADLFANREPIQHKGIWGAQTFSVSKLAIALSDFTVLVWIALAIKSFLFNAACAAPIDSVIAAAVTMIYVASLFKCRQSERKSDSVQAKQLKDNDLTT